MAYHEHDYEVFVLKGAADSAELWSWRNWEPWATALAPFASSERGKAAVRCQQYSSDPGKMVSFGRLSWDEKSHQRWAHSSPNNAEDWKGWKFLSMQAWAPGWTICEREYIPPDFYFSMKTQDGHRYQPKHSGPFVVCAIRSSLGQNKVLELESILCQLAQTLPASVLAHKKRPWGIRGLGANSFTYAIQDMTESVLSGPTEADRIRRPFDEDLLPESWRKIDVSCA